MSSSQIIYTKIFDLAQFAQCLEQLEHSLLNLLNASSNLNTPCSICSMPRAIRAFAWYHRYAISSRSLSRFDVLVTLGLPSSFSSREITFPFFPWIMPKQRKTSSQRKCNLLKVLAIGTFAMRPCSHCSRLRKACKIVGDSNKCLECIRLSHTCDLAPLDINRYRRLEEQRKKLKAKLHTMIAKQQRLI